MKAIMEVLTIVGKVLFLGYDEKKFNLGSELEMSETEMPLVLKRADI